MTVIYELNTVSVKSRGAVVAVAELKLPGAQRSQGNSGTNTVDQHKKCFPWQKIQTVNIDDLFIEGSKQQGHDDINNDGRNHQSYFRSAGSTLPLPK